MKQTDIKGYRSLTQEEVELINKVKTKANEVQSLIELLHASYANERWLKIATTDLQKGFMALNRSIMYQFPHRRDSNG